MLPISLAKAEDWPVAREVARILAGQRPCHSDVTPGAVKCSRPDANREGPGTPCATRRTGHARPRSRPGLTRTRRRMATRRGLTARAPAPRLAPRPGLTAPRPAPPHAPKARP